MEHFFNSINYIEEHINDDISIHDIANSAFQSTYHFSRVFKILVGDSPKEYLRKRRLSIAAKRLLNHNDSILQLALDSQFESQEAFTRAFKKQFNITPAQYRKVNQPVYTLFREKFTPESLHYLQNNLTMEPEIITQPETKIVGLLTHYNEKFDLLKVWQPFTEYAIQHPIKNMTQHIGIGLYEASSASNKEDEFSYICSVPVSNFNSVPAGMVARTLPEQLYAKFTHTGCLDRLHETLKYIWGSWLPKSNYLYEEKSDFELYPSSFNSNDPKTTTYLHIPIRVK